MDKNTVYKVQKYLKENHIADVEKNISNSQRRADGKRFTLQEHVEGMILSLLSPQTVWEDVERNLGNIRKVFFDYVPEEIKKKNSAYYTQELERLHLRSRFTAKQMTAVNHNIEVLERLEREYGSVDAFVADRTIAEVVKALSNSASVYKLQQMAEPLVCEYLRNVGVDTAKPDEHLRRMLGSERLGVSRHQNASISEVITQFNKLSKETGMWAADLDYLFWCYCATDKAEICSKTPACHKCVIWDECRQGR
jgi:3-methyladenine DNA glycosylase Tag